MNDATLLGVQGVCNLVLLSVVVYWLWDWSKTDRLPWHGTYWCKTITVKAQKREWDDD